MAAEAPPPRRCSGPALRPRHQVNMRLCLLSTSLIYTYFLLCCSAVPRAKDYLKISGRAGTEYVPKPWDRGPSREPSCEELLAMWRFSKRQSRATEITNEISTYRDPFAYNVWEPHARSRSMGGAIIKGGRGGNRHVYGRVVHAVPRSRVREQAAGRARAIEEVARHLVAYPDRPIVLPPRRKVTAFRFSGAGAADPLATLAVPQTGSFQQLKEIIRSERARELQEQRLAEEAAARAAALRDEAVGVYSGRLPPPPPPPPEAPQVYENIRYGRRSVPQKRVADDDDEDEGEEEDDEGESSDPADKDVSALAKYPDFLMPNKYVDDDLFSASAFGG